MVPDRGASGKPRCRSFSHAAGEGCLGCWLTICSGGAVLEIPEAATLARQAHRLLGRTVVAAVAGHSPHGFAFYSGDPGWYASALRGRGERVPGMVRSLNLGVTVKF